MLERLTMAPADPILDLTLAFQRDPNPDKINLGVGEFRDEAGATPTLGAVRAAEERLLREAAAKTYLPIPGLPEYGAQVERLLFGEGEVAASKRAATAHTPGGTGALRIAGDFIKRCFPGARIWVSDPTWPNHYNVFRAAGLE